MKFHEAMPSGQIEVVVDVYNICISMTNTNVKY